jgi:hypothetical protein
MAPSARRAGAAGRAAGRTWGTRAPLLRRLPMVLDSGSRFLVAKSDRAQVWIAPDPDAPAARELQEGEARLAVCRFSLGADTLAFGGPDSWSSFPCEDRSWGCIPTWGFATVSESCCADLHVGTRVFGRLPMGTHLVVQPAQVGHDGFVDGTPHRRALPQAWQQYAWREGGSQDERSRAVRTLRDVQEARGAAAVESVYRMLLAAGGKQHEGWMLSL